VTSALYWEFSKVKKANRTNEGDDRLKNRKRDRHTLESDRKSGRKMMAESKPSASAARRFVHKAYQSYTVENYLNKLGVDVKGVAKDSEKF